MYKKSQSKVVNKSCLSLHNKRRHTQRTIINVAAVSEFNLLLFVICRDFSAIDRMLLLARGYIGFMGVMGMASMEKTMNMMLVLDVGL